MHPQDAIDLAPADAGTEIEIADGTYGIRDKNKDINVLFIDKGGLHVYAANGYGAVTLDADCTGVQTGAYAAGPAYSGTLAAGWLGELTGKTAKEDLVATIFSKFCVGK